MPRRGEIIQRSKQSVAVFLIEGAGLIIEGIEVGVTAAASYRLRFSLYKKPTAPSLSARILTHDEH